MSDVVLQLKSTFASWDLEGTGTIKQKHLETLLTELAHLEAEDVNMLVQNAHGIANGVVDYRKFLEWVLQLDTTSQRSLSLPKAVAAAGGINAWNEKHSCIVQLSRMLDSMCRARTVEGALEEVQAVMLLGHFIWAYAYMRRLYNNNVDLYYAVLQAKPSLLMPVVYTPTVGEACQKFGKMPLYRRGCYLSITDKGRFKDVLQEYAEAELFKREDGRYFCECIVFSDAGRILGLGDLGAWGMAIPIGKLDLYTVCAGVNPHRTIPVIVDAGCYGTEGNTGRLVIRDHELYTGLKQNRVTHKSAAGTTVNSAYYGEDSLIREFMDAAIDIFGKKCLLQFEDFNSNDAFPLLAEYRDKCLTYNDDIQGTAGVAVAGLLGAIRLRNPSETSLLRLLREEVFLFHGAGSANIGVMRLLRDEAGVPGSSIFVTNSRGLVWVTADGKSGNFRNDEQKEFAQVGEPAFDTKDLVALTKHVKATCLVGAVGVAPGCFTKQLMEAVVANTDKRPIVFALSNPKTQAEITAEDAYTWSSGKVIFGSGTWFAPVELAGRQYQPGQVNNVYIFPGMSYGAICCDAQTIPESFFMRAAEAVANSLTEDDIKADRVVPHVDNIQHVSLEVATAVVLAAQELGLAGRTLGTTREEVRDQLAKMRWVPSL